MTFQEALTYFIKAPFQPKQAFQQVGSEAAFETSTIKYLVGAEIFWYLLVLLLFPFREMEFFSIIQALYFVVPLIFSTFGLAFALGAVSNFTMKHHLKYSTCLGLVALSFLPVLISVTLGYFMQDYSAYFYYGSMVWVAIIIGHGIKTLRFVELSSGLITGVIALFLVAIASHYFFNFMFMSVF